MIIADLKNAAKNDGFDIDEGLNFNKPKNNLSTFPYCCAMFYSDFYTESNIKGNKIFREQWCIRTDNYSKAGMSPKHLTFFNMGGLFNFSPENYIFDVSKVLELISSLVDSNNLKIVASEKLNDDLLYFLDDSFDLSLKDNLDWKVNFKTPFEGSRIELFFQKGDFKMELWNMSLLFYEHNYSLFDSGGSLERLASAHEKSDSIFNNYYFDIHRSNFNSDLISLFPSKYQSNYFLDISRTLNKLSNEHDKNNLSNKQHYHLRQLSLDFLSFLNLHNLSVLDLQVCDSGFNDFLQKREIFFNNKFSVYEDHLINNKRINKDQIPSQIKELVHKKYDLPVNVAVFPNILHSQISKEKDL